MLFIAIPVYEEQESKVINMQKFLSKYGWHLKPYLYRVLRFFSYIDMQIKNKVEIKGMKVVQALPSTNVMFVSNHETYYMDVILMCQALWNSNGRLSINKDLYFVAAEETALKSPLLRHLDFTGCVPLKRQWKHDGEEIQRERDEGAIDNMAQVLKRGWLINFPTGTVDPSAIIRPGLAKFLKHHRPIVVPVQLSGVRKSYGKTGFVTRTFNNKMKVSFSEPLSIDYEKDSLEKITALIGASIDHPDYNN